MKNEIFPYIISIHSTNKLATWFIIITIGHESILHQLFELQVHADHPDLIKLQEAIDKECKIREGAGKLLQLSTNNHQSMEASKSLFISNMKILELMKKLQKVQRELRESVDISKDKLLKINLY